MRRSTAVPALGALAFFAVSVAPPAAADCVATWTSQVGAVPPPRWIPGMTYDVARERTVLFGGGGGDGTPSAYLGDTWLWDGALWSRAGQGAAAPEARLGAVLVYDERRERAVLFGGTDTSRPTGNNYFPETWEWNGSSWTRAAAAGPGGRLFHAMAYDAGRGRVVLFGGDRDHTTLGDTWEFDGGSGAWSQRATSGPAARFAASLAYDRKRGVVVLFGGVVVPDAATGPSARNDTWEWDGAAWHERSLAGPLPSARYHARLVWDAAREALVLAGGTNGASDSDPAVWELDGSGWHERESAGTGARYGAGTAWDSSRARLVVFGGARGTGILGDTWERRAPVPGELLAPIVLDAFGVGGAHFLTEMSLTNRETTPLDVALTYTASLGSGSGTVSERLEAGQQRVIPDVLELLRQRGLPIPPVSAGAQAGTLFAGFGCVGAAENVALTVRVISPTSSPLPAGRAGLAFTGERASEGSSPALMVYGLRANAADRSNIAVYNTSASAVTLRATALSGSGDGARVVIDPARPLPPHGWFQWSFDATGLANGSVLVEKVEGSGTFGAYGVVDDNVTNDGSILGAVPAEAVSAGTLQLPVIVETPRFTSEFVLANGGSSPARLDLTYTESLADSASGTMSVTLAPGEQRILPGAIDVLRRGGVPLGAAGAAARAGSVRIALDPPSSSVYAGARTASPAAAGGGFGLFTPAVSGGARTRDEAFLYGLRADAENRSNVAVVNAGSAGDGAVTLALEVHDGDDGGRAKGTPVTRTLDPGQWFQADGILAGAGVRNGWVRAVRLSGTAPWLAYGVVNDGGQPGERTGDGAYVPMVARAE
ncbi:MAG TPA: kelch repeat-containing protein [Thermoanaerobaculia bacterium]|nr:kelch repeat-containing protein [Thermoanaerobaculia bacterium]